MVTSVFLTGRRTDTHTGGTQSRRDAATPRHPTRPKSTGPAPPRHGTTTLPWRPCTELHSRASTRPIAHNRHSEDTVRRHPQAQANDVRTDTHKHDATGPGPRQHAGHAGHQPRAAHTPNPCPPACCSPICLPRRSRLAGQPEEVGESSRGWRGGWVPDARAGPGGRVGRPRWLGRPADDGQWRSVRHAVTWQEQRPPNRWDHSPAHAEEFSIRSLTAAWRLSVSMPPSRWRLGTP